MSFRKLFGECCRGSHCIHYPRSGPDPLAAAAKRTRCPEEAHVLEAPRQEEIRQELLKAGWKVRRVGQKNAKSTQDPGIADLYCLHPRLGALWVECKRPHNGVMSRDQIEFREDCANAGVAYVCASQVSDLTPWLYPTATHANPVRR